LRFGRGADGEPALMSFFWTACVYAEFLGGIVLRRLRANRKA
jgi:hypothetical protein